MILVENASSRLARLKDGCSCRYFDDLLDVARLEKRDWQMMIVDGERNSENGDRTCVLMKDWMK